MASSDRVQPDPPRGCLRAFALAVVVMRSALAEIWHSILSICARVCRCAASIRQTRVHSRGGHHDAALVGRRVGHFGNCMVPGV